MNPTYVNILLLFPIVLRAMRGSKNGPLVYDGAATEKFTIVKYQHLPGEGVLDRILTAHDLSRGYRWG